MKHLMPLAKIIGPLCAAFFLAWASLAWAEETNVAAAAPTTTAEAGSEIAPLPPVPPDALDPSRDHILRMEGLIPFAFFGMIVSVAAIGFFAMHRKNRMLHETLRALIEKGQPIPPELLQPKQSPHQPSGDLGRGLILMGIGLGLIIMFVQRNENWGVGMIPMLIGVAYLIAWKIETKKRRPD